MGPALGPDFVKDDESKSLDGLCLLTLMRGESSGVSMRGQCVGSVCEVGVCGRCVSRGAERTRPVGVWGRCVGSVCGIVV